MIPFHSVLPELAQKEVRCLHLQSIPGFTPGSGLSGGEYAFVEFYCADLECDCRRVFIQVMARHCRDQVLASINYGWEDQSFYRQRLAWDPDAPGLIVRGSLDPLNEQSPHAAELLELFQQHVLDKPYRLRLRRHYQLFREELQGRKNAQATPSNRALSSAVARDLIPLNHRRRFEEVAVLLEQFGKQHLDPELAGFTHELWKRLCRRKAPDCLRGKAQVWAASVVHVIARMNFLFDRQQPVHLTFEVICVFFGAKNTVGGKATEIERTLRLAQHSEPGLCRGELLEQFTTVRLGNGIVLPWAIAKQMGYLPPDARVEDLR